MLRIEPVIVTGADPTKVIPTESSFWKGYCRQKSQLQQMLLDSLPGVVVIDSRDIVNKSDCADFLCHMKASGQKKVADLVILEMGLKKTK